MESVVLAGSHIYLAEQVKFSPPKIKRYIPKKNIPFKLKPINNITHDLVFNAQAPSTYFHLIYFSN